MFKLSVKIALRNIQRRKLFSFIIIFSLAFGLSSSDLLTAFLSKETSAESFNQKQDRIYRVLSNSPFAEGEKIAYILDDVSQHLSDSYASIESLCRIYDLVNAQLSDESQRYEEVNIIGADDSFQSMFNFPLENGKSVANPELGEVVLSSKLADRLFGQGGSVGKTVSVSFNGEEKELKVCGVIDQSNYVSHLVFDAVVNYHQFGKQNPGSVLYALLTNHDTPSQITQQINEDGLMPSLTGPGNGTYDLQPLKSAYFDTTQKRSYYSSRSENLVWTGGMVALLILIISGFNFVNFLLLSYEERITPQTSIWREVDENKKFDND